MVRESRLGEHPSNKLTRPTPRKQAGAETLEFRRIAEESAPKAEDDSL